MVCEDSEARDGGRGSGEQDGEGFLSWAGGPDVGGEDVGRRVGLPGREQAPPHRQQDLCLLSRLRSEGSCHGGGGVWDGSFTCSPGRHEPKRGVAQEARDDLSELVVAWVPHLYLHQVSLGGQHGRDVVYLGCMQLLARLQALALLLRAGVPQGTAQDSQSPDGSRLADAAESSAEGRERVARRSGADDHGEAVWKRCLCGTRGVESSGCAGVVKALPRPAPRRSGVGRRHQRHEGVQLHGIRGAPEVAGAREVVGGALAHPPLQCCAASRTHCRVQGRYTGRSQAGQQLREPVTSLDVLGLELCEAAAPARQCWSWVWRGPRF